MYHAGASHRNLSEGPRHGKRVTWDLQPKEVDRKTRENHTLREQLQSVTSDLTTTRAEIEMLKRDHSQMNVLLKQLHAKIDAEAQKTEGHDKMRADLSKLQEAHEKQAQQQTADVRELRDWVKSKVEELVQVSAFEDAQQDITKLLADIKHTQQHMGTLKLVVNEEGARRQQLESDLKASLQDKEAELKSQMRNHLASISAELRTQRNALEMERSARDTGDRNLGALFKLRHQTVHPRLTRTSKEEEEQPAIDQVTANIADLARQLQAEVAARTAAMHSTRSTTCLTRG